MRQRLGIKQKVKESDIDEFKEDGIDIEAHGIHLDQTPKQILQVTQLKQYRMYLFLAILGSTLSGIQAYFAARRNKIWLAIYFTFEIPTYAFIIYSHVQRFLNRKQVQLKNLLFYPAVFVNLRILAYLIHSVPYYDAFGSTL